MFNDKMHRIMQLQVPPHGAAVDVQETEKGCDLVVYKEDFLRLNRAQQLQVVEHVGKIQQLLRAEGAEVKIVGRTRAQSV